MADEQPRPEAKNPGKGLVTVEQMLRAPAMLDRFKRFAVAGMDYKRLWSVALLAVQKSPLLLQAHPLELSKALMHVTSLGLEVNSPMGQAYLIPFKRQGKIEIQVIIGYRGLAELMHRTGNILSIDADIVTEVESRDPEYFQYQLGFEPKLMHRYHPDRREDDDNWAFAYAVVRFKDGGAKFEIMKRDAVLRVRNQSSGYQAAKKQGEGSYSYQQNPWVKHEWEMGKKTVFRRSTKLCRLSPELARAVAIDEAGEDDAIDLDAVMDLDPSAWTIETPTASTSPPAPDSKAQSDEKPGPGGEAQEETKAPAEPSEAVHDASQDEPPPPGEAEPPSVQPGPPAEPAERQKDMSEKTWF